MQNYYEILEVNECASQEVIEKVYKIFIKKYHPDLYKDNQKLEMEEKIKTINEAYETLSDPEKRKKYDETIEEERKNKYQEEFNNMNTSKNDTTKQYQKDEDEVNYDRNNKEENISNDLNGIMLNQLNRFENILSKYEQVFYNNYQEAPQQEKVTTMDVVKYKLKKGLMIFGIIALTGIILYFVPFTRAIIDNIFSIFSK